MELLLQHSASVGAVNEFGDTPLHVVLSLQWCANQPTNGSWGDYYVVQKVRQ